MKKKKMGRGLFKARQARTNEEGVEKKKKLDPSWSLANVICTLPLSSRSAIQAVPGLSCVPSSATFISHSRMATMPRLGVAAGGHLDDVAIAVVA